MNHAQSRKSSINPQTVLQKSLNSLDFQQQKSGKAVSSSLNRNHSGLRSRDKLPEIGLGTKLQMYSQRIERNIHSGMNKLDKATMSDIYHVSEYCSDIQKNMQLVEK